MEGSSTKPVLSVIIVSFNSLPYLKNCISSVWQYNDIGNRLEVIVVDNSTNKETVEWLNHQHQIISIANDNKGFGQANNVGARIAKGDYLLFLNPDTVFIEPVFKFVIQKFEEDPLLGLFGVQLVNDERKPNSTYGVRMSYGLFRVLLSYLLITLKIFIPKIMYTSGADLFVRKIAFQKAGSFDENIFMYCEETDLCNRINSIGYKNSFFKERKIIHLEGKTSETNLFSKYVLQMTSSKYLCRKYNIDFKQLARKERRYCSLKKIFLSLVGKKQQAIEYERIIHYIDKICE